MKEQNHIFPFLWVHGESEETYHKNFPTGYANGKVLDAPVAKRRQGLLLKTFTVKNGKVALNLNRRCHPPGFRPNSKTAQMCLLTDFFNKNKSAGCKFTDDQVYSVAAIRTDRPGGVPVSLTEYVQDGMLRWNAPEGQWQVQMCCLSRNIGIHRSYINMMDKDSCRIQLEAVYEPHYAHYGDKFGTVIAGFFSDEPELGNNYMYRMYNTLGTE